MWGALYEPVYRYTPFHPNPDDNAEDALDMFDPARIDWGSNDEVVEKAYSSTLLNEEMASQFRTGEGPFTLAATQVPQVFAPVSWDNMTPGAKWVVIRMLSDNCPVPDEQPPREPRGFAQVVTTVLKLDRAQIQTFLAVYISDFESYQAWEYQTLEIPWAELLEEASEQNVSVMDLLPVGRPELCTDAISSQEVDQITSFLCGMHLDEFVAQASDWYGLNMSGDFVNLNVESDLLLDALDSALLRRVVALGWIKLAAIRAELQQQNRQPDPNSPLYELLSEQGASTDIQDAGAASQNPDAPADAPAEEDAGQPEDKVTKKRRPAGNKRKRKNGAAASSETVDENAESTEKTANTGRKGRGATKKKNINSNVGKSNAELPDGHPLKLDKNAKNNKKNGAVAAQVQRKVFPHGYASLDDKAREIAEAEYERTEPLTFMSGPELPGSSNFYIRTPSTMPVGPVAHPFEQSSDAAMSESTGPTLCSSQVGRSDDPKMNRRTRKPSRRVRENTEFKEDDTDVEFEFEYAPEQDGNKKRRKKNAVTKSNNAFKSSHIDETTDINGQVDQVADNYIIFNTTTVGQSMSTNMGTMPQGGVPAGLGSQSYHKKSQSRENQDRQLLTERSNILGTSAATPKKIENQENPKTNRSNMPLFGIPKHQGMDAGPKGRLENAGYAWSSHHAVFASVATRAQYALKADRVVPGLCPAPDREWIAERMERMRREFVEAERRALSKVGQDAEFASYAGCADSADYALDAEEADFAFNIAGGGETQE